MAAGQAVSIHSVMTKTRSLGTGAAGSSTTMAPVSWDSGPRRRFSAESVTAPQ